MMREIKFRAWWRDTLKKVIDFNDEYTILACEDNAFIVEQYTGLKDKNGVDIYEGDLVKNVGTPKLKQVVYHDQAFYLREGNAHTRLSKLNFDGEIIGNIHEHKHLLK